MRPLSRAKVSAKHPLRMLKGQVDWALRELSAVFDEMYSQTGRPSIPPERSLKATLLMALYTVRSERLFCEQLQYNLLFRWFLDMDMVEQPLDHSTFSQNRQRLIEHDVAKLFFAQVVEQARKSGSMSSEHFTVDGTLIEAWASLKSFKPKKRGKDKQDPPDDPGNPSVDFRGQRRSNQTHESTTDPESKLATKSNGTTARMSLSLHSLMENRNGLLVDFRVAEANGTAERKVALNMLDELLPPAPRGSRWAPTKPTTHAISFGAVESATLPLTSPRTNMDADAQLWTLARRARPDTRSVSEYANASKRSSAGQRRSATSAERAIEASYERSSPRIWLAPPTTSCG